MRELILATHNPNKTREFAALLGDQFVVRDLAKTPAPPVKETGKTFAENATLKAVVVSRDFDVLVAADDSGLEANTLAGAPGVFSARYAGEQATDRQNIEKLLRELGDATDRSARFRCVIALARQGRLIHAFEGSVEGRIIDEPRGRVGFGYDPVFIPTGYDQTFAQMTARLKNQISHRAKAAAALREFLLEENNALQLRACDGSNG